MWEAAVRPGVAALVCSQTATSGWGGAQYRGAGVQLGVQGCRNTARGAGLLELKTWVQK